MSDRPFTREHVLGITIRHMRKNVNFSIKKTLDRVSEFADDTEKSGEVFKTLIVLYQMRKTLNELQIDNTKGRKYVSRNQGIGRQTDDEENQIHGTRDRDQ